MPDVFLYQGELFPSDVRLADPTVPIGGGAITGAANLVGTGTLQAAGLHAGVGLVALSGTGVLTAGGVRTRTAGSTLSGTGVLTVSGTRSRSGAASLTGHGTLVVSGNVVKFGVAALSGLGSLTVSGSEVTTGAALLAAAAELEASGFVSSPAGVLGAPLGGFTTMQKRHHLWDDQEDVNERQRREHADGEALTLFSLLGDDS